MCRPLNTLPLPMLKDNYESASDCLREDDLRQAAVEGETEVTGTLNKAKADYDSGVGRCKFSNIHLHRQALSAVAAGVGVGR